MTILKLPQLGYLVRLNNNNLTEAKEENKCLANRQIKEEDEKMKMTMMIDAVIVQVVIMMMIPDQDRLRMSKVERKRRK